MSSLAKGRSNQCHTLSKDQTMLPKATGLLMAVNFIFISIMPSSCPVGQLIFSGSSAEAGWLPAAGENCQVWPVGCDCRRLEWSWAGSPDEPSRSFVRCQSEGQQDVLPGKDTGLSSVPGPTCWKERIGRPKMSSGLHTRVEWASPPPPLLLAHKNR